MRAPVFTRRFQQLDPAARKFLFFVSCNIITWQCIAGPALVLFAREIRMPESQVGWLQSFMPLCMILIIFTSSMVERLGPKRLMTLGWLARTFSASLVFLMPWAIAWWGDPGGWNLLIVATFGFCLIRALSVSGWFPWLHEIVPAQQRGLYFGLEMSAMHGVNVALALVLSLILQTGTGLGRFYVVYAIGVAAGFFSLILIQIIPGGGQFHMDHRRGGGLGTYGRVLRDWSFLQFCFRCASGLVCFTLVAAASMMYLRDILGVSPSRAMMINAAAGLAVALTINGWGGYIDRHGSGPVMFLALTGHSLVAGMWLLLRPEGAWSLWLAWPTYIMTIMFFSAFQIGKNQGLLSRLSSDGKVAYTNLLIFGDSLAMGITPIIVGALIEHQGLWGFRLCFAVSCLAGLALAVPNLWAHEEGKLPAPYMGPLIRTTLPLRAMARALWLSMGLFAGRNHLDAPNGPVAPEPDRSKEPTDHGQ